MININAVLLISILVALACIINASFFTNIFRSRRNKVYSKEEMMANFRNRYPDIFKDIEYYKEIEKGVILIFLADGGEILYDHNRRAAYVLSNRWL